MAIAAFVDRSQRQVVSVTGLELNPVERQTGSDADRRYHDRSPDRYSQDRKPNDHAAAAPDLYYSTR